MGGGDRAPGTNTNARRMPQRDGDSRKHLRHVAFIGAMLADVTPCCGRSVGSSPGSAVSLESMQGNAAAGRACLGVTPSCDEQIAARFTHTRREARGPVLDPQAALGALPGAVRAEHEGIAPARLVCFAAKATGAVKT